MTVLIDIAAGFAVAIAIMGAMTLLTAPLFFLGVI